MSFEVHAKRKKWVRPVRIACILVSIAILAAFALLIRASGSLLLLMIDSVENNVPMFVAGLFTVSLVLPAAIVFPISSFYRERRPRIEVNGSDITFYPRWGPSKKVTLWEITARTVKGDTTGEKIDAAVGGALLGPFNPSFSYALDQRYEAARQAPKALSYTYYSGNKKLIAVSARGMENMERFDNMVVDQLFSNMAGDRPDGKPLPGTEAELPEMELPEEEAKPAKRTKLPLVLGGLAGVVCLAAVIAMVFIPRTAAQSQNLLAGTSWIAANDGSQWVFREDHTFHWYQTKGKTDDNYFAGTYEFHIGRDALNYLTTELSRYGVTEREMLDVISRAPEYTIDNFVCFSCVNQSFLLHGKEQLSRENVTSYFGFLLLDGKYLDIANMTTGTYYGFMKE